MVLFASTLLAQQYTISGVVTSAETGEKLVGANVYVKGTTTGAATDVDGKYSITVDPGTYTVICSYVGFERQEVSVDVTNNMDLNFSLKDYQFSLSVTVLADRAKERETPVAFTNLDKEEITTELGSQDIPLVLNSTPSVYATVQGGGAGDARVNVRGFNQRNVAVMINGVPVNDMENGWVYWSNWDGVGDATSSIQVQRGLSAVNLATPSIGGTMNIITDPTQLATGVFYKNEIGSGNFNKQTLFAHSGLIDNKFAMSFGGVRKVGDGVVNGAWTDAWAYYAGLAYQIDDNNRLELYANGAPQRHGQRRWKLNAATFSHELARDLGYQEKTLDDPLFAEQGILYNSNWSPVSSSYYGQQWWDKDRRERYSHTFINESENFYHKPIINLNWYSQLSNKLSLYTTAYWSGGNGGGTGYYGSMRYDYSLKQRVIDYDATIARNRGNLDTLDNGRVIKLSRGVLRNSVNRQWTIGAIAKAYYKVNKNLTVSAGLDWRTAEIDHFRTIRDMLGGDYFKEDDGDGNQFDTGMQLYKSLGDKVDYSNTNTVNWIGGFVQGEYTADKFTLYGTFGYSMVKYDFIDYFKKDAAGNQRQIESDNIGGYQIKGGASFRVNPQFSVYANAGYVAKVPIFDQVIDDVTSTKVEDPGNEKFLSFEVGANATLLKNKLSIGANVYFTDWKDRYTTENVLNADGSEGLVKLDGISSRHMGVELDASFQPHKVVRFDLAFSKGIWEYTEDISGTYVVDISKDSTEAYNYYLDGLKVGDAPQTQLYAGVSLFPFKGFQAQLGYRYYTDYYSEFDPFSRTNASDREQVWKIPAYGLLDLHINYNVPLNISGVELTIFAHVFNLLDELYVQDAVDNSTYNSWYEDKNGNFQADYGEFYEPHNASAAEVYPGLPRTYNLGFSIGL